MARVPYVEERDHPELAELIGRIKAQRGGRLLNLYKTLLNSPPIVDGWLHLLTAIRHESTLDPQSRELAMTQVAVINGADYEYNAHAPLAVQAGCTEEQVAKEAIGGWRGSSLYDDKQRAVLAYCEAMTKEVHVSDEVFAAVERHFEPRQLVELTATIAAYNMVSRFLEALAIDPEQPRSQ